MNEYLYPVLMTWIKDNGLNFTTFGEIIGVSATTVRDWFTGRHLPNKYSIDCILGATGMTYEEAFGARKSEKNKGGICR